MNHKTPMKDIPIIRVEPLPNPIRKGMTCSGRPGFHLDVNLHLEGGGHVQSTLSSERKKNLPDRLAGAQRSAAEHAYYATFSDTGEYYGTKQVWAIDASNATMTPSPDV